MPERGNPKDGDEKLGEGAEAYAGLVTDVKKAEVMAHATKAELKKAAAYQDEADNPLKRAAVVSINGKEIGTLGAVDVTRAQVMADLIRSGADAAGERAGQVYDKEAKFEQDPGRAEAIAHGTNDALDSAAAHQDEADNPLKRAAVVSINGEEIGTTGVANVPREQETADRYRKYADWSGEQAGLRYDKEAGQSKETPDKAV